MNILLVAHERNLGGASKSLVTLADELRKKGNKVVVVIPFKAGQVYAKLKELQIPVHKIFFGWWMMPSYWNPILKCAFRMLYATERIPAVRIARLARKENIQIIHSNSSAIDVGALAAEMAKLPHVWHFREFGDMDYQLEYLKGRKKSCQFVSQVKGKAVFISNNLRDYYREEIADEECTVIYNGISEDFLCPKEYKKNTSKVVFLISGNLHRNKGQDTALKAVKILKDKGFDRFELWIAGQASAMSDSKKYEQELREFADHNLKDYCRFLGFVSDMKELRKKTDIELVCSNREAFGRVTVEAMMSGNPVIGTDTGANPELIEDHKNGRLFQNGNAQDLAEKMQWFLENPEYIEKCGREAYTFSNRFLSSVNTENIDRLYRELAK
ncbi:MAG: glycosyltransferase family 4 protein [Lachnospiraceae bacterium]|nr:glycosyltransferase family 4 protein [Lachnospiraceae bacterium]